MNQLLPRNQFRWAESLLRTFPAVVIQGARQVGKSTFASQLAVNRPHVSVTLDDLTTREAAASDPKGFVAQAGEATLIIDEIQREPSLILAVKAAIDENRQPGRFLITGSSDLLRLSRTPDSLAGRAVTLDMHGFSQGEKQGITEDFASWARASSDPTAGGASTWNRQHYVEAIAAGSFPEAQTLDERFRNVWLDSYIDRLLTRDIGDVSRGLSSDRLHAVFRLVATNQGGELVQARLADALAIPKSSISAYLSALSVLYLTLDLPPWRANLTQREVGRHKISVADTALALRASGLRTDDLRAFSAAPALGRQLEAFVVGELVKQRGWSDEEFRLFHFRDRDGLEVDVVIEYSDGRVFLLEVKASETYRQDHTKSIRALADRLGDRFIGGAVLGLAPERQWLGERIWGLPVSTLWQHE